MMHPSRKAYVEEQMDEVRNLNPSSFPIYHETCLCSKVQSCSARLD